MPDFLLNLSSGHFLAFDIFLILLALHISKAEMKKAYFSWAGLPLIATFASLPLIQVIYCGGWIQMFSNNGQPQYWGIILGAVTTITVIIACAPWAIAIIFLSNRPETT